MDWIEIHHTLQCAMIIDLSREQLGRMVHMKVNEDSISKKSDGSGKKSGTTAQTFDRQNEKSGTATQW